MTIVTIWAIKLKDDDGDTVATFLTGNQQEYLDTAMDLRRLGAEFEVGSLVNVVPSQTLRALASR